MITRAEFQLHEDNMAHLADVLRDPIVRLAIEVVKNEGMPMLPDPVPGVDYGAQTAAMGAHLTGWSRAIRALETLPLRINMPERIPIEKQFDLAARRRMRASGIYSENEIENTP